MTMARARAAAGLGVGGRVGVGERPPGHRGEQARPARPAARRGPPAAAARSGASSFSSSSRFCSRACRSSARLRASPELSRAFGLAGLLLELELLGAVVPVGDLLGQPVLHRGLGLVDQLELAGRAPRRGARARRCAMAWPCAFCSSSRRDPGALGPREDRVDAGLVRGERPVVEVGRVVQVRACARRRRSRRRASAWRRRGARPSGVRLASWMACSR